MENEFENEDSINLDLEVEDGSTGPTEAEKKLFARAKKAEAELKAMREANKAKTEINTTDNRTAGVPDEVIDLRLDGYSKEEVDFIIKNGGRKVLEDKTSYVTIALNTKREQARAESEANKVSDSSNLSEVERKHTPEQLKNMSAKELEELLPHAE